MDDKKVLMRLCTKNDTNESSKHTLLNFNKRDRKILIKRTYVPILLYCIGVSFFLAILFTILSNDKDIIKTVHEVYPILLFPIIMSSLILLIVYIHIIFYYPKLKKEIEKSTSIKVSEKSYTFIEQDIINDIDDISIKVVRFIENDIFNHNKIRYDFSRNIKNVNYDDLIKNHNYKIYLLNNKKIFVVDDYYD